MAASRKRSRLDLAGQVKACLARHLEPGAHLRVGFSGGVDSVVLLHLLAQLAPGFPFALSALHVHHGLNPKADAWAEFCQAFCERLGVPCEVVRVSVPKKSAAGLEAAARSARYAALCRPGADAVALAHHLDDQAETVLFQLLRGGEPRALAAMPKARVHAGMLLLRPLLNVPKSDLIAYARRHRLKWVEDDSNLDTALARNALRQDILPLLEKHFPDYRERLAGVSRRMAEVASLLEHVAGEDRLAHPANELDCKALKALPEERARNLLAHFLRSQGAALPRPAALREMLRQLREARGRLSLPLPDGRRLCRTRNRAHLEA
ncbi:MAG: tRNA lysidine(34) synthetase TilS [Pseudomonadota bacterium]